ncbi:MAG: helicase-related protein, partial [Deltaproteobacteria bacterium]
ATSLERRLALLSERAEPVSQLMLPFLDAPGDEISDRILAAPGLRDPQSERAWLERLIILAEHAATSESKVRALRRLLRRACVPALVFTEYRDTLERVSTVIGGDVEHLHGGMTSTERERAAARFTAGDGALLLATDAASEGLNLQRRCHLVVNLELPWSPVRLEQRIGRVDRIGQRARVHAINLVAATTIEERIVERLLRRADRARAALELGRPVADDDIAREALGERSAAHGNSETTGGPTSAGPPAAITGAPSGVRANVLEPPGVSRPPLHLRTLAVAEADCIRIARGLLDTVPEHLSSDRPLMANLSKRRPARHRCWAIRIRFVDGQDEVRWETLFGIHTITGAWLQSAPDVRQALGITTTIEQAIARAVDRIAETTRESLLPVITLAAARERSLHRLVERQGARLAAVTAQRSLFDRRVERAAAAQRELADEAARRCHNQLRTIEAMRSLSTRRRELVFAVAFD